MLPPIVKPYCEPLEKQLSRLISRSHSPDCSTVINIFWAKYIFSLSVLLEFCVFVLAEYSDDRIVDFTPVFLPRFPPSIKKGANLISRLSGKWGGGDFFSPFTGNPPDL